MLVRQPSKSHQTLYRVEDKQGQLCGWIASHSASSGPTVAGVQIKNYPNEETAIRDTLALASNMACRTIATDLNLDGGAIVIPFDPDNERTPHCMTAMAHALNELKGRIRATAALGASGDIMAQLSCETEFVAGLEHDDIHTPAKLAARSAFNAIRIGAAHRFGSDDIADRHVAMQGLGHVGWQLCTLLHQAGVNLVVADPDPVLLAGAVHAFGARMSSPRRILAENADILAPCSVGGILTQTSIGSIKADLIAGPASNQLAKLADADILHAHGVLYLPDCLVSAGGIIQVASEVLEIADSADWIERKMADLATTLQAILSAAKAQDLPPIKFKDDMIRDRLARKMSPG